MINNRDSKREKYDYETHLLAVTGGIAAYKQ